MMHWLQNTVPFVYHLAMWHIHKIATMEVKSASILEISFFWKLLDEVLC